MTKRDADPVPEALLPASDGTSELDERGDEVSFPVVGVGASAGGLEAVTQLLQALPADTGMAFVVVQHLAPTHPSALAEILSRATKMPVTEVHDELTLESNHVYVIPPDRSMIIARGTLQLLPREIGVHRPIDQFFRSLAEDRGHQSIAVVLSGTATDGTLGLEAIKGEGGITFAQDGTALHEGMPSSAIASGCVDFVLPPEEIAREIARIGRHPYAVAEAETRKDEDRPNLAEVAQLLHQATGVDFSHYKWNTLYRRVTRRMVFQKVESLDEYVRLLRQTPSEVEVLYRDILISVTSFFRDEESYEALKSQVFPRLLEKRGRNQPVRIWTLGCSTGQEAYSLIMALTEVAEARGLPAAIQLFATDLNPTSIEKARAGLYSKDIVQDVSPERLRRFFTEVDGQYRISKTIRDACVFSRHNVLADPPFSHLDLISCRNLLIYLKPVLQQRVIPTLHYALEPGGTLWLGGSESISGFATLFETEDGKHKIYRKKAGPSAAQGHFLMPSGTLSRTSFIPVTVRQSEGADLPREADRLLSSRFAPPGVLVSSDLEILQFRGQTDRFLAPAPGKASLNLLKMLREGLLIPVRAAVLRAGAEHGPVREEGLRLRTDEGNHEVTVEVIPVHGATGKEGGFLVLFEDASGEKAGGPRAAPRPAAPPVVPDADAARLGQELVATREYLRSLIEQQEAANEELQSASEEVQSANEELQSTNEELETSKEEIQSSNEELTTVNDELHERNAELSRVNNDLVNLLGSIQTAIVILGPDLRLRRFTPAAEKLLNLIPTDVGRPLSDIQLNLENVSDLDALLAEVLDTVSTRERDVQDKRGRWFSLRLRPYRTLDHRIDGVVLMLIDVDSMKRAHAQTESIVATLREPLLVLDGDLRVQTASRAFYHVFGAQPGDTVGRLLGELGSRQWDIPDLHRLLEKTLRDDAPLDDYEVEREVPALGKRAMILNARRLIQLSEERPSILLAIEDITARKRADEVLRESERRFREIVDALPAAVYTTDATGRITHVNPAGVECIGRMPELGVDRWSPSRKLFRPDGSRVSPEESPMALAVAQGRLSPGEELILERPDGTRRWVEPHPTPLRNAQGQIIGGIDMLLDITERKQAESAIKTQNERLHQLWEAAGVLLSTDDPRAMLHGLVARIGPQLGVDGYFDYALEEGSDTLRLISSSGVADENLHALVRVKLGESISGGSAVARQPIAVTHIQQSDDPKTAGIKALGIRAYVSNPLMSGDRLLGTLSFASRSKDQFAPDELSFLQTISHYVAFAYARQQAQGAVRESEERLRFLMDSMPQKIFTATPGGAVDYFNPQWMMYSGLSFEQISDWGWTQLVHPDDLDENVRVWKRAMDTGEPFQHEHRFRRADGEYRWHFSRATPMRDEAGRIVMWVGSNTDVQDIKQAEVALQDSELRYRRLFEAAKDGILILDFASGKIVDSNPFMSDLLGYSQADFLGKELWEIGLYRDKAANEAAVQGLRETGYLRHEHLPLESKHGRTVEVEVVANAYREARYRVIQCNIRDITERSHLEEQLKDQAKELSDLHRRKDEFLAMLSHELRNPLAPIADAVRLLGLPRGSQSPIQQKACGIIERQVEQLQHLVDDLLEVSRITTGRIHLRRAQVALHDIVSRAVEAVTPLIEQRKDDLTVSLPPEPIWLWADAARLHQVVVNLLTNAAKFSDDGSRIAVSAALEGEMCVLRVRDSGVSISPELLPHVFELFTQADRSLDRSQGGLGIGLALVKRLTELHGGTVEAHSVLGEGSEFVVRLPVAKEVEAPVVPPAANAGAPATRALRVLVVDDNADAALMLAMLLEAQGHEVQSAQDGPRALAAALAFHPRVVLLDIGLPGMDGYEVAKKMRLDPACAGMVLVALTGYGQASDRERSRSAGFDHHLVKPADFAKLKEILASAAEGMAETPALA
jgi:two-component system CheB/CheR fusion protein